MPHQVVVHPSVDTAETARAVAKAFALRLAAVEAFWELISVAALLPATSNFYVTPTSVGFTTVVPGSGGHSGGWTFGEYDLRVPDTVLWPPSRSTREPLSDGDLFVAELNVSDLHPEIALALDEALRCFRHELYDACLAMLGKAGEGSWIEAGLALASVVEVNDTKRAEKLRDELLNPANGVARKIPAIYRIRTAANNVVTVGAA